MEINKFSSRIIKAAINVHRELGPGLLESVYQKSMVLELRKMGLSPRKEVALPVYYQGELIDKEGFRLDILVDDTVGKETIGPFNQF